MRKIKRVRLVDRKLWGVELKTERETLGPLFMGWATYAIPAYEGEPTRPLLFTTRKTAREWCKKKMMMYADRKDCCAMWRFRPIRVNERLRRMGAAGG